MKQYPDTITIEITPETDANAKAYFDPACCRLSEAARAQFPDADIRAGFEILWLDDDQFETSIETADAIADGYKHCFSSGPLPDAKPVTVVLTKTKRRTIIND